jgi:pyruvate formate lyase activating enzyme
MSDLATQPTLTRNKKPRPNVPFGTGGQEPITRNQIMKACIFDIKRFALHDGPGIRITVFFKGCPMTCWWCHNPEGINPEIEYYKKETKIDGKVICENVQAGYWITIPEMIKEIEKERIFMEESGGGVTFSGGEPLLQHQFLIAALKECRKRSIHACLDTSGIASEEIISEVALHTDLFLYDLKLVDDDLHLRHTGISNKQILQNLELLVGKNAQLIIRIPLVPGVNDDDRQIDSMINYLTMLPGIQNIDILPFHHFARSKYERFNRENRMKDIQPPSHTRLEELKTRFASAGFTTKIGG